MDALRPADEDEVIAAFLRAEIGSPRWGRTLQQLLARDRRALTILSDPDLTDPAANRYRRKLLGEFRGWGQDQFLLKGFPPDISWSLVSVRPGELARILYIDWPYWVELSGGTRRPKDALKAVRANPAEHPYPHDVARRVYAGEVLPELIAVAEADPQSRIVAVEGHARLTGYVLALEALPPSLRMYLGRSPRMSEWGLY